MTQRVWYRHLTWALATGLAAAPTGSDAQAALKTDRQEYVFGDTIRLTASVPPKDLPRQPIFTITLSWESERRQRVLGVNSALLLGGYTVMLPAPFESGDWQIRLYDRAKPSAEPIAAVSFRVAVSAVPRDTTTGRRSE